MLATDFLFTIRSEYNDRGSEDYSPKSSCQSVTHAKEPGKNAPLNAKSAEVVLKVMEQKHLLEKQLVPNTPGVFVGQRYSLNQKPYASKSTGKDGLDLLTRVI